MPIPPIQDIVTLLLIFINVILTLILFSIYLKNYRKINSKMTLGLTIFAGMFLIENILNMYFYGTMSLTGGTIVTTYQLMVNFFELIGFGTLFYITWKT